VGDDVVELLRYANAFLCDSPVGEQLSLAIEALGAFP
jgi:hypothetical protein